jgi:hypothetical protein
VTQRYVNLAGAEFAEEAERTGARAFAHVPWARARQRWKPGRLASRLRGPLGDAIETFIRRADAERFVEEVRRDDPELASYLRIEERELEAGGPN